MDFSVLHPEKDELKLDLVQRSDQGCVPRRPRGWREGEPCENRPDSLGWCLPTSCQAGGGRLLYLPFR